jgi:hypothetical protein
MFTITANAGYKITNVLVNGTAVGAVGTYTFSNIRANNTISASFERVIVRQYTITATAGTNGSISPSGTVTVDSASSRTFTITANAGFTIDDVKANGTSVGAVSSYTFSNISANQTIAATFKVVVIGTCDYMKAFGVPRSTALPTTMKNYSRVYVLGTGGPDLTNVTGTVINWDLPNKGLWQLSFNTNNGIPGWWIDFRGQAQTFASNTPAITFSGTGIANLSGKYYANVVGSNNDLVLVAASGSHAIYFSLAATAPICSGSRIGLTESTIRLYPTLGLKGNPIVMELPATGRNTVVDIISVNGTLLSSIQTNGNKRITIALPTSISAGLYFYKVKEGNKVLQTGKFTVAE